MDGTLGSTDTSDDAGGDAAHGGVVRAYVGLGANVGDAATTLAAAVRALARLEGARLVGVSRLYATDPWGVIDQPEFRNAVVALDLRVEEEAAEAAHALLVELKRLERAFGRRARERWGPRELDLDLLAFGPHAIVVGGALPLVVPHPRAADRLFVVAPLAELAPDLVPPGWSETVTAAAQRMRAADGAASVRPVGRWSDDGWVALARP